MSKKGKKNIISPEAKQEILIQVRRKFRSLVHLIIYHKKWLMEDEEDELGDNVMKNIQLMLVKKKGTVKTLITRKHKSVMMKPLNERTQEEIVDLANVLNSNKFFKKYSHETLLEIAEKVKFHFYPGGRYIYSQDRPAVALYIILSGEANGLYKEYDPLTHQTNIHSYGHMVAGYAIGIVNIMCEKPRSLTVVTACAAEVLSLAKEDFDLILKTSFKETYMKMAAHYNMFTYLRSWDPEVKRVCSILSKWRMFKPDQIMLSDNCPLKEYAFFIICGVCYMVECLKVLVTYENKQKVYSLHARKSREKKKSNRSLTLPPPIGGGEIRSSFVKRNVEGVDLSKMGLKDKSSKMKKEKTAMKMEEEMSLGEEQIEEEISEEYLQSEEGIDSKINQTTSEMSKGESAKSRRPTFSDPLSFSKVEYHFIKICDFRALSCFNIGERMKNREVIAKTNVHTLLIPKEWLIHQNMNNVWSILISYLNRTIPKTEKIFENFMQERVWREYKANMVTDIMKAHIITNTNTRHHIPYCTRLQCPEYFYSAKK